MMGLVKGNYEVNLVIWFTNIVLSIGTLNFDCFIPVSIFTIMTTHTY